MRLHALLALATVSLLGLPASGEAPDPCATAERFVEVCATAPAVAEIAKEPDDAGAADVCALLYATRRDLWSLYCRGTYSSTEICLIVRDEYGIGPWGDQFARICGPLAALVCDVSRVCAVPVRPATATGSVRPPAPVVPLPAG